jgi:hypothetical protein
MKNKVYCENVSHFNAEGYSKDIFSKKFHLATHQGFKRLSELTTNFFTVKPTRCTNFSNLVWNETLHVSGSSSVHHQEFFTVHTAMVYVIQVCRQLSSRIKMEHPDPAR